MRSKIHEHKYKSIMAVSKRLYMPVILLLSISLTSFASNTDKAPGFAGIESFNKTFPQAVITEYKSKGDFTEVSFVWNGLKLVAFYSEAGELLATSRTIALASLPVAAQLKLKANYSDYTPHNAIEFDDAENAIRREKRLKIWNRAWKIRLIEELNPNWEDLYPGIAGL